VLSVITNRLEGGHGSAGGAVLLYTSCVQAYSQRAAGVFDTLLSQLHSLARHCPGPDTALLEACNQALQNYPSVHADAKGQSTNVFSSSRQPQGSLAFFVNTFKTLLQLLKVDVLIVLDAVDALAEVERQSLSEGLRDLLNAARAGEGSLSRLRVLVGSSKPFKLSTTSTKFELPSGFVKKSGPQHRSQESLTVDLTGDRVTQHDTDLELQLSTCIRELPGLSRDEQDLAVQEILRRSMHKFSYVEMAIKFMREPLQRPLESHLKGLPKFGSRDRSKFDAELLRIGPNYARLLRTALTWALLGEVWPQGRVVMDDFHGVYRTAAEIAEGGEKSPGAGFPPLSELDIEQLRGISGLFLSLPGDATDCRVFVHDVRQVSDYCFATPDVQELDEYCARCQSYTVSKTLSITEKDGHLDLVLACLTHINHPLFQRQAGLYKHSSSIQEVEVLEPRYEIQCWPHHLREAEDRWPPQERASSEKWSGVFQELDRLIDGNEAIFNAWQKAYQSPSGELFSLNKPHQPLHVAAHLGLASWTDHLIRRGERVDDISSGYNALQAGASGREGRRTVLEILLKAGANLNVESEVAPPAFHMWLSQDASAEALDLMNKHGADPAMKSKETGWTALHHFAKHGTDPKGVGTLIARGGDINCLTKDGYQPLHILLSRRDASPDLLRAFVQHKADVNAETPESMRPLQLAARWGDRESLEILFESEGKPQVNDDDKDGNTAAQQAAIYGHISCVEFLRRRRADLNHRNHQGRTALHHAARGGHANCIAYLLKFRADPRLKDNRDVTALFDACGCDSEESAFLILDKLLELKVPLAEINHPTVDKQTPLNQAAIRGLKTVVKRLVEAAKAEDNLSGLSIDLGDAEKGMTALHCAVENGHVEVVRILLDASANVNIRDSIKRTALALAVEQWTVCRKPVVKEIISLLVDKDPKAASTDPELSALCAIHGSTELLKKLRYHGADFTRPDQHGWTPLELARSSQQTETEAYLKHALWTGVLPSCWVSSSSNTTVSAEGLVVTHSTPQRLCLTTDRPLPAGLQWYYFEVTVRELPSDSSSPVIQQDTVGTDPLEVAIGFCTFGGAAIEFPGWPSKGDAALAKSWGYHSDDGCMYKSPDSRSPPDLSRLYGIGATVGCGVDFEKSKSWFTLDGKKWDFEFGDVQGRLFPLLGLHHALVVETNFFGPFMWKGDDDVQVKPGSDV
jgi:ankyrin repeat protein